MTAVATHRLDLIETIASIPSLLGFHPQESVVIVAMKDHTLLCTARTDLDPQAVKATARKLADHGTDNAIVVVYSDEPANLTEAAIAAVTAPVMDVITNTTVGHVANGIYHRTDGTRMQLPTDPTPFATRLVVEGNVVARDRDAFLARAEATSIDLDLAEALGNAVQTQATSSVQSNRETEDAIYDYLTDPSSPTPSTVVLAAWIAALNAATVREPLLARLAEGNVANAGDRAMRLVGGAPRTKAVAAALAFTAAATWLDGTSPLAMAIAEEALAADANNVLADLVHGATGQGVPPSVFAEMLATMTLKELRTPKTK